MTRRIGSDMEQRILELDLAGENGHSIARITGLGTATVARVRQRNGLPSKGRHKKFSTEDIESLAKEYSEGVSLNALARRHDTTIATMSTRLKKHGVTIRRSGGRVRDIPDAITDEIVEAYRQGYSHKEIATQVNLGALKVSALLKNRGEWSDSPHVTRRRGGPRPRVERHRTGAGYITVYPPANWPWPEMVWPNGLILEHRMIMAQQIGRALTSRETVHHINGDNADNRLDNLQVRFGQHGPGAAAHCGDCGSTNIIHEELG